MRTSWRAPFGCLGPWCSASLALSPSQDGGQRPRAGPRRRFPARVAGGCERAGRGSAPAARGPHRPRPLTTAAVAHRGARQVRADPGTCSRKGLLARTATGCRDPRRPEGRRRGRWGEGPTRTLPGAADGAPGRSSPSASRGSGQGRAAAQACGAASAAPSANLGSSRRMGMRLTTQRKARTPRVTRVRETANSIQLGT